MFGVTGALGAACFFEQPTANSATAMMMVARMSSSLVWPAR
jgi:hypothetical protein